MVRNARLKCCKDRSRVCSFFLSIYPDLLKSEIKHRIMRIYRSFNFNQYFSLKVIIKTSLCFKIKVVSLSDTVIKASDFLVGLILHP